MMDDLVSTTLQFLPTRLETNKFVVISFVFAALLSETIHKSDALGCSNNSACSFGKYCCKKRFFNERRECKSNCIGGTCYTGSECAPGEYCSSEKKCATKAGKHKDNNKPTGFAGWSIAVIVIGVVVGITVPVVVIYFICKIVPAGRRSTPGVINHRLSQDSRRESTTVVLQNTQNRRDPAQPHNSTYTYQHFTFYVNPRPLASYHSNHFSAYSGDNPPPYPGENPFAHLTNPSYPYPDETPPPYHSNPLPQYNTM